MADFIQKSGQSGEEDSIFGSTTCSTIDRSVKKMIDLLGQEKINDVGNNIFRTQRCNQFPVGKNGFLLMNEIEYNE
ncbi:hypothetical protein YC2023_107893 [Brassica napus]